MKICLDCSKEVENLRHTCPHCGGGDFRAHGDADDIAELMSAFQQQDEASVHVTRGAHLCMEGQFSEAEAELKQAISINPLNATAHGNLGGVYLRSGRPEMAVPCLEKALELNPNLEGVPEALREAKANCPQPRGLVGLLVFLVLAAAAVGAIYVVCRFRAAGRAREEAIAEGMRQAKEERRQAARRLLKPYHRRVDIFEELDHWEAGRLRGSDMLRAVSRLIPLEVQLLSLRTAFGADERDKEKQSYHRLFIRGAASAQEPVLALKSYLSNEKPCQDLLSDITLRGRRDPRPEAGPGDLLFDLEARCTPLRRKARGLRLDGAEELPDAERVIRARQLEIEQTIRALSARDVLHPMLGTNYLIRAQQVLDAAAAKAELTTKPIRDGRVVVPPTTSREETPCQFNVFRCTVYLEGNFQQIVSFLALLENCTPCPWVSSVSVSAQPGSATVHAGKLGVGWLAWGPHAEDLDFLRDGDPKQQEMRFGSTAAASLAEIEEEFARIRDPFLPQNWKPPPRVPTVPAAAKVVAKPKPVKDWDRVQKTIQLAGLIGSGDKTTAVVKMKGVSGTRMVNVGEVLDIQSGGFLYKWRVTSISPQGLGLERLSATQHP